MQKADARTLADEVRISEDCTRPRPDQPTEAEFRGQLEASFGEREQHRRQTGEDADLVGTEVEFIVDDRMTGGTANLVSHRLRPSEPQQQERGQSDDKILSLFEGGIL